MSRAYELVMRALDRLILARQALEIPPNATVERMDNAMSTAHGFMGTVKDMLNEVLDILEEEQE